MTASRIKPSVWDDSEPDYAPCLSWIRGNPYWVCPKKYKDAGYSLKTYRLEADAHALDLARVCRELTREVLRWYDGEKNSRAKEGTWGWLALRYIHDEYSQIHEVRPQTRADYIKAITRITDAIADVKIIDTDFAVLSEWKRAMERNGRSAHYIKKWFTHFGLILSHGVKLKVPGCIEVKSIRSEMRIRNPAPRYQTATRAEIEAIVAEADRRGADWLALAVLIRFEFVLRGVDVYGHWVPAEDRAGGIRYNGRVWQDGLTWDMIDADVITMTKVISKTSHSLPEPYAFDLTNVPDIRRRLLAIENRIGPVIVVEDGLPPRNDRATKVFKQIVRALGLPDDLRISDARSGGITEAKGMVDPFALRDAAQHTQISTTDRYARGRSAAANKVVQMRKK